MGQGREEGRLTQISCTASTVRGPVLDRFHTLIGYFLIRWNVENAVEDAKHVEI